MMASTRYWDHLVPELAKTNTVVVLDLLGFGRSPAPRDATYDATAHIQAVIYTLDKLGVNEPFVLAGHSMGARVALKLALAYPKRVKKLVLLSMPVYASVEEARNTLTRGKLHLKLTYYGPTARIICAVFCHGLRPIMRLIAPYYLRQHPKEVAKDGLLHTWQSFSRSMGHMIEATDVQEDLLKVTMPLELLYGENDHAAVLRNVKALKLPNNTLLQIVPSAGHNLPLQRPETAISVLTT
jgi:pimeloyl-ACP methyl ester carboxylesterase